jgi:hypothetical protein
MPIRRICRSCPVSATQKSMPARNTDFNWITSVSILATIPYPSNVDESIDPRAALTDMGVRPGKMIGSIHRSRGDSCAADVLERAEPSLVMSRRSIQGPFCALEGAVEPRLNARGSGAYWRHPTSAAWRIGSRQLKLRRRIIGSVGLQLDREGQSNGIARRNLPPSQPRRASHARAFISAAIKSSAPAASSM